MIPEQVANVPEEEAKVSSEKPLKEDYSSHHGGSTTVTACTFGSACRQNENMLERKNWAQMDMELLEESDEGENF